MLCRLHALIIADSVRRHEIATVMHISPAQALPSFRAQRALPRPLLPRSDLACVIKRAQSAAESATEVDHFAKLAREEHHEALSAVPANTCPPDAEQDALRQPDGDASPSTMHLYAFVPCGQLPASTATDGSMFTAQPHVAPFGAAAAEVSAVAAVMCGMTEVEYAALCQSSWPESSLPAAATQMSCDTFNKPSEESVEQPILAHSFGVLLWEQLQTDLPPFMAHLPGRVRWL